MMKPSPHQILAWVHKHFKYKTKQDGTEIRICNPYDYPPDTRYSVYINPTKAMVNDHRPRHKKLVAGTFLNFVRFFRKISFHAAIREVMGDVDPRKIEYDIVLPEDDTPRAFVDLPPGFKELGDGPDDRIAASVRSYLHSRLVTDDQIEALGVGYDGYNVVFPYHEFGDVVYWQARSILNKRFDFPEGSSKADFLYGFDNLDPDSPAIITESIFNSLMFDHGAATGGCTVSEKQKRRLRLTGVKDIIIAYDNDESKDGGIHGTIAAHKMLHDEFTLFYSIPDSKADWNDIAKNDGLDAMHKVFMRNIKKLDLRETVRLRLNVRR